MRGVGGLWAVFVLLCGVALFVRRANHTLRSAISEEGRCGAREDGLVGTTHTRLAFPARAPSSPSSSSFHTASRRKQGAPCPEGLFFVELPLACFLREAVVIASLFSTLDPNITLQYSEVYALIVVSPEPRLNLDLIRPLWRVQWLMFDTGSEGDIPSEIGLLTTLRFVNIAHHITDTATPSQIGLLANLEALLVYDLTEVPWVPSEIFQLTQLTSLELSDQGGHVGELPTQLVQLTNLIVVRMDGGGFYGTLTPEIGSMQQLQELRMPSNHLSGSIPTQLGRLSQLTRIALELNEFTGSIPSQIGVLTRLQWVSLAWNQLSGTLPSELGLLHSLNYFEGQFNRLHGLIPSQLAQIPRLYSLNLRNAMFSGTVPPALVAMLVFLDIRNNRLSGTLPPHTGVVNCANSGLTTPECVVKETHAFMAKEVFYSVVALFSLVLVVVAAVVLALVRHRDHNLMQHLTPTFGLLLLGGLTSLVVAVLLFGLTMIDLDKGLRSTVCQVFPHFASYGWVVVFTSVSARHYDAIRTQSLAAQGIRNKPTILAVTATAVVLDVFLVVSMGSFKANDGYGCNANATLLGSFALAHHVYLASLGLLTLASTIQIRRRRHRNFDSGRIARMTLVFLTFGSALVVIAALSSSEADVSYLAIAMCVLLVAVTAVAFVFVPKLKDVLADKPAGSSVS